MLINPHHNFVPGYSLHFTDKMTEPHKSLIICPRSLYVLNRPVWFQSPHSEPCNVTFLDGITLMITYYMHSINVRVQNISQIQISSDGGQFSTREVLGVLAILYPVRYNRFLKLGHCEQTTNEQVSLEQWAPCWSKDMLGKFTSEVQAMCA